VAARASARYRRQGSALFRATTWPHGLNLPPAPDLTGENAEQRGRAWLAEVWQHEEIRQALSLATPALCHQIDDIVAGQRSDGRRIRRTVLSLASYLLPWQGRPTPFGLFAGVAPAHIAATPRVTWGDNHRTTVRADADWLTDLVPRLHHCPDLLERLPVVANNAGQVRGSRYVVPGPPADGRAHLLAPIEVSVRYTRPVAAALAAARAPTRYGVLRAQLTERAPAAADRIDTMLAGLVAQHVLITSLWAPMTCLDALGHISRELERADADTIPDIAELVRELFATRDALARPAPLGSSAKSGLVERMRRLSDIAPVPVVVDTALDCELRLPEQVVREAEEAVSVLYRLSPYPFGYPHWRDYHRRFRMRYGPGAVVPLLELVADSGLGLPAGYLGSDRQRPERQLTERDEKLLALIQQAMLDGSAEIVLTDRMIADLAGDSADVLLVPRAEVSVEIHATSQQNLSRGAFRLVVTGTPRPGSSMAGRFAHLLPDHDHQHLADSYRTPDPEVITAQLSFAPRRGRNDNVTRTPQLLPHVISLAEHRAPEEKGLIELADLAVTADARQLSLLQRSTGRPIEPRVAHALEAGIHTPPLARFLAEITTARSAVYKAFDFGAANHLPYLPRVRYKRTILARARWLLTAEELPARSATMTAWEDAFAAWRSRLGVPERVSVVEVDQRLPLDLAQPLHRLLLRSRLDGARRLELREATAPEDIAWIGRAHELLLTLTLAERSRPVRLPAPDAVTATTAYLPGRSTLLHAHLHAHPERYEEILTTHLPALLDAFPEPPPRWWFQRHRETSRPEADPYLVLSVCLAEPAAYGQAAAHLGDWADHLRRRSLASHITLATYEPQTGRFGHGPAMDAAHEVFAADSAAALAQVRMTTQADEVQPQALAAASMVDLATRLAPTVDDGLTWLVRHLPREHGPLDRSLRDQAFDLTDPTGEWKNLRSTFGGTAVATAWQARATALDAYRKHLADQRDPLTVLRSLLHLHHVRALTIDPDLERLTGRLARACALRAIARSPR
jgi:thiopeptide-type bacteriocin biosynthesis protein